ncbi:hypothetical protein PHLGIDRAFT_356391 [Phlebiopsis gigantea 11061_1 CR5-6]|uniref:Glycoside hydrolase family 16 protein n=1 Tax=Phlebiopsis gigantea (strain 11061_1 CR5-6) TaxID=745531 RepID=A0A0C3RYS4_PHLG1|nr:hypothetical protein PHLGIDRAFT_356391 [Phlebiopsis gigantea 11061_1 CR5-6]
MSHHMSFIVFLFYVLCALQVSGAAPLYKLSLLARGSPPAPLPPTPSGSFGTNAPDYPNRLQMLRGNYGGVLRRNSEGPPLSARQEANARPGTNFPGPMTLGGADVDIGISSFGAGAPIYDGDFLNHLW